ncbi:MAG: hypothetical protein ACLUE1_03705 [Adlercreutzia equolifaciens]
MTETVAAALPSQFAAEAVTTRGEPVPAAVMKRSRRTPSPRPRPPRKP